MNARTPQPVIDKLCYLLRNTEMSMREIAKACGVNERTVAVHSDLVEPEFRRTRAPLPSPEIQILMVSDAIAGLTRAEIARRYRCSWHAAKRVLEIHRETTAAGRAEPSPAKRSNDWIAEDPALKRSLDRLRAARGILPVSEFA
jgi:hypothetical protein